MFVQRKKIEPVAQFTQVMTVRLMQLVVASSVPEERKVFLLVLHLMNEMRLFLVAEQQSQAQTATQTATVAVDAKSVTSKAAIPLSPKSEKPLVSEWEMPFLLALSILNNEDLSPQFRETFAGIVNPDFKEKDKPTDMITECIGKKIVALAQGRRDFPPVIFARYLLEATLHGGFSDATNTTSNRLFYPNPILVEPLRGATYFYIDMNGGHGVTGDEEACRASNEFSISKDIFPYVQMIDYYIALIGLSTCSILRTVLANTLLPPLISIICEYHAYDLSPAGLKLFGLFGELAKDNQLTQAKLKNAIQTLPDAPEPSSGECTIS